MKFIAERYKPDLVMMPIGGNFTMDPVDAAWAARNWIKAPMVMPIHYNSNPCHDDPTLGVPPNSQVVPYAS